MSNTVLQGLGVGKTFGDGPLQFRALHPVDIEIRCGEVVVIMGPSGSGKTTLLSILGLLLSPTEGEVRVGGRSIAGANADDLAQLRRDNVGFVFQQFNLLPGLTALENVAIPLLLRGASPAEGTKRSMTALERVGMQERHAAKARLLSGGQQQRVAIARALVADAAVLLCDEPTASLDSATGRVVLDVLKDLALSAGRAVVIVTHDERVLRIADRLIHVEDGRVRADGRPS